MRLPRIHGIIRRRLLVNFRVDPAAIARLLPAPFRPKLHDGAAIAGICLIRLEAMRPLGLPGVVGVSSENAAHRIAVRWDDEAGAHEGVYIPRRDTGSWVNRLVGGRLFSGEQHGATFHVDDTPQRIALDMRSTDGEVRLDVIGRPAEALPPSSAFATVEAASAFFEPGSIGYSATTAGDRLDRIELTTRTWKVAPLEMERVTSSYFEDPQRFPPGSATFDCALIMRDIAHEWRDGGSLAL